MTPKQPTDNGPSKIVTLPATGPNATNGGTSSNGVGPGKIVTLPAGTVGKVGSNPVVKMTVPDQPRHRHQADPQSRNRQAQQQSAPG